MAQMSLIESPQMKKMIALFIGGSVLVSANAANAVISTSVPTISFTRNIFTLPTYTTAVVKADFEDYVAPGGGIVKVASILPGTVADEIDNFDLQIRSGSSLNVTSGTPQQFISFAAGNFQGTSLVLKFSNNTQQVYSLGSIAKTADASASGRFNFDMGGSFGINSFIFTSGSNAFRLDDIASAAPEPATWTMMILGFGLVGWTMRRRKATGVRLA